VWIDHFHHTGTQLVNLLHNERVLSHPFVIGELACGNLANRQTILALLKQLPRAPLASHDEVLTFIETRQLMGQGLGYIDAHLLAATMLAGDTVLWTNDKRLKKQATELALSFTTS
jgi:predicted nucleic acid-binding protein